jgi:uncharacterized delta-60 repeat protein
MSPRPHSSRLSHRSFPQRSFSLSLVSAVATLSMTLALPAWAAPGDLDTTFSGDGRVTTNFTRRADAGLAIAVQDDGKLVVAGGAGINLANPRFALSRYNADGTLDTTFGGDGKVTTDFTSAYDAAWGIGIQSDGKIVASGDAGIGFANSRFALARYNTDGTLDATFGGDGKVTTNFTRRVDTGNRLVIQTDGKIVVVGAAAADTSNSKFALARYNSDGTLDTTFSGDGKQTTDFTSGFDFGNTLTLQADGRLVAGGVAVRSASRGDFALARYNTDGSLDSTFSGDGRVIISFTSRWDIALGVDVQTDGKIVAAGIAGSRGTNPRVALARFNADGTLDATFGVGGRVTTDFTSRADVAFDVTLQTDDRAVVVGESGADGSNPKIALARYNIDGSLDTSFSGDGKVTTDFTSQEDFGQALALQADGNIVVAGGAGFGGSNPAFAVARYLAS